MKKIYHLIVILSFSSVTYCMEVIDVSKKDDQENKDIINSSTSQSAKVPNLNLNNLSKSRSIKDTPKTTVRSRTELQQHVTQARKTHRDMRSSDGSEQRDTIINVNGTQRMSGSVNRAREINQNLKDSDTPPVSHLSNTPNDDVDTANNTQTRQKSILPRALNTKDFITNVTEGRFFSEEEVWEFLKSTNSALHTFSIHNKLSIDDVVLYANLLDELHVHPQALVEHIKKDIKLEDKSFLPGILAPLEQLILSRTAVDEKQIQGYQKIQQKDPEKYQRIVLEVLKGIVSQEDGQHVPSPLHDTHIEMLENQTASDAGTIRYQYAALAVSFLMWVGTTAWGIYGQVTGTATLAPTRAPTNSPTMQPTMMPTGAPT